MVSSIDSQKAEKLDLAEVFEQLESSAQGLSAAEAQQRLAQFGRNALEEKKVSPLTKFLGYFWGPIPWMIEVAAVLSALVRHWDDFVIILALLAFNAAIGFWQEYKAANALEALKSQLALKARALRDGAWDEIDAAELVPGDVVRLRLGDIIPADTKLVEGEYLSVDQSALTGESLPVNKKTGEIAYSGSVAKQGEMLAVVTATGGETFFGRTAKLVEGAGAVSHFQKAVLAIGDYLIYLSLALVAVLIIVQLFRHAPLLDLVQFALILTVASIPVAMPAVLSVTMAVGALALSKMEAIVSRLQSIEEMAGIDILCSDKTGTLTQNKLTLGEPAVFGAADAQDLILAGSLASKAEDKDAIDLAVLGGLSDATALEPFTQSNFVPFDPVSKRTEADIEGADGKSFKVTKGAPQVILELAKVSGEDAERADKLINELAAKGFRTLGVARSDTAGAWQFLGILPLFDPPREDSKDTIRHAEEHGISVRMVTGDNAAIAREIAAKLDLGTDIQPIGDLLKADASSGQLSSTAVERIEDADGFAQVFPEHKYAIVKAMQARGHLVAMTGDGVNDAPALKQADVGIAVSGATDAARAAADLVLTAPGLSTIVSAVEEARRIFERMNSLCDLPHRRNHPHHVLRGAGDDRVQFLSDHRDHDHPAGLLQRRADHGHRLRQHLAGPQAGALEHAPRADRLHRARPDRRGGNLRPAVDRQGMDALVHRSDPDLHLPQTGRGRAPHAVRRAHPQAVLEPPVPVAAAAVVGHRDQGAGDPVRDLPVRAHHPDRLERRRPDLGLLHRLDLHRGLGQARRIQPLPPLFAAAPQFPRRCWRCRCMDAETEPECICKRDKWETHHPTLRYAN